jgi:hypothetical protein
LAAFRQHSVEQSDEATSAIDVDGEQLLYNLLQEMGSTYLSVAHRVTLVSFHRTQLTLTGDGGWKLSRIEDSALAGKVSDPIQGGFPADPEGLVFELNELTCCTRRST